MTVDRNLAGVLLVSEAAEEARVSVDTIYREIAAGRLVASRIRSTLRIQRADYDAWLERTRVAS